MFLLTPIVYEASAVPPSYQALYRLNPMVHLIEAYRNILVRGKTPDWAALMFLGILAFILLGVGLRVFTRASYRFVEEL